MDNKLSLTWKDVYNSQRVFPMDFHQCREMARMGGYKYLAFNGIVYSINDSNMSNRICTDESL